MKRITRRIGSKVVDCSHDAFELSHQKLVDALFRKTADYEDILELGQVQQSDKAHKRITSFKPIETHYENPEEKPYIKYSCPICFMLGNKHQVAFGEKNCMLCNVNLNWDEDEEGEKDEE